MLKENIFLTDLCTVYTRCTYILNVKKNLSVIKDSSPNGFIKYILAYEGNIQQSYYYKSNYDFFLVLSLYVKTKLATGIFNRN